MRISQLAAHEILDSKGDPTIEVSISLENGVQCLAQVPSGASVGATEAIELRDNDPARYDGKGVLQAVNNVNTELRELLVGQEVLDQAAIDNLMIQADGTPNKGRLGGNAIVGVSMAVCRAASLAQGKQLYQYFSELTGNTTFEMPQPLFLIMEGGKHGNWAADIQEFHIIPKKERFGTFREMLRAAASVFHSLGKTLLEKKYDAGVGFEGAYAPSQLKSNDEAFELIMYAISRSGLVAGVDIDLAIDAAASEFFQVNHYQLLSEDREVSTEEWRQQLLAWVQKYPITSYEDVFHQEEWSDWQRLMEEIGDRVQIVGDDLVTTNVERIRKAIELKAMNATLIKVNQIGTITETLDAIRVTHEAGFNSIISHRGGETNDDLIADLAVGTVANQCKFGGPDRGERLAKYNRLLRIENQLLQQ